MKALLIVFIGGVLVLFSGLQKKETSRQILTLGILFLALIFTVLDFQELVPWEFELKMVPQDMMFFNRISFAFISILLMASIFVVSLFKQENTVGSDLLGLLMFSLCGGIIMIAANNLVMLFIGIEVLSIPLYVLAGSNKYSLKSNEAAIKYFLMGAFSTAIFLLGCAFIYGVTGGLDMMSLYFVVDKMVHLQAIPTLMTVGVSLVMVGMCFKISAVPFHFWSPDVYEGSPNRTTVFMATIVKVAAFAAFFRLFSLVFAEIKLFNWGLILAILSAVTIITGNVAALIQKNVKRTLAYSSVAHAGYMMMALVSISEPVGKFMFPLNGFLALLVYSVGYVCASAVIFYYFNKVSTNGDETFAAFSGLGKNNPIAGIWIALSMFSLAGIPLTAGFAGKYLLFTSVFSHYPWLVIIALIGSAVSIAYYFRIFKSIYFEDGNTNVDSSLLEKAFVTLAAGIILIVGCAPWLIMGIDYLRIK